MDLALRALRLYRRLRIHLFRVTGPRMQIATAKAAILTESRKPLVIGEIAFPETLDVGQVLVKVLYSTICGAQINEIAAAKGPDRFLPHLLGHEASAVVLETGPGVTTVKAGDTVVLHWRPSQ